MRVFLDNYLKRIGLTDTLRRVLVELFELAGFLEPKSFDGFFTRKQLPLLEQSILSVPRYQINKWFKAKIMMLLDPSFTYTEAMQQVLLSLLPRPKIESRVDEIIFITKHNHAKYETNLNKNGFMSEFASTEQALEHIKKQSTFIACTGGNPRLRSYLMVQDYENYDANLSFGNNIKIAVEWEHLTPQQLFYFLYKTDFASRRSVTFNSKIFIRDITNRSYTQEFVDSIPIQKQRAITKPQSKPLKASSAYSYLHLTTAVVAGLCLFVFSSPKEPVVELMVKFLNK